MSWPTPEMALKAAELTAKAGGTKYISSIVSGIWTTIRHGRAILVVVGPGGTGKSSLRKWLVTGKMESVPAKHQATAVREREGASSVETFAEVWDYPGQQGLFDEEFNHDEINNAKRLIVICCCSYGYHSDWGEADSERARKALVLSPSTRDLQTALEECRNAELKFVEKLAEKHLFQRKIPIHMITVVLKQDLWTDNHADVQNFYTETVTEIGGKYEKIPSKYQTELKKLEKGRVFTHRVLPLFIRREDLKNNIGDVEVTASTKGITDTMMLGYQRIFLDYLSSLLRRSIR